MPLLRAVAPFTIGEENGGLVSGDEFLELGDHVGIDILSDVIIRIHVPAMNLAGPFGQGVIKPHL